MDEKTAVDGVTSRLETFNESTFRSDVPLCLSGSVDSAIGLIRTGHANSTKI